MEKILIAYIAAMLFLLPSCKKLVTVGEPTNSITKPETFATYSNTTNAMAGIYYSMREGSELAILNGGLTVYCGTEADELIPFASNGDRSIFFNSILTSNSTIYQNFWTPAYNDIYQINAFIEGVNASSGLSQAEKIAFTGEARFLRGLCNFYLVNLFGDIPYPTSSNYTVNTLLPRTPKAIVYDSIVNDLLAAQSSLPEDYSLGSGDRARANKWAATALLARVYLYKGDYPNAEKQASLVINNTGLFNLNPDLNSVFLTALMGNNEAILQWIPYTGISPLNATVEGWNIVPFSSSDANPRYYISTQLLDAFEAGDQRKANWLYAITYQSQAYYCPYKYKIGQSQAKINAPATEYPTILRLAEQYLIRAEAEANGAGSGLLGAIDDLNIIRRRAGLADLPGTLNNAEILSAVMQERRVEFFAEWGHRWFDLKRTGQVDSVMTIATPLKNGGTVWKSYQRLWPINPNELLRNPNLTQTPGYN